MEHSSRGLTLLKTSKALVGAWENHAGAKVVLQHRVLGALLHIERTANGMY